MSSSLNIDIETVRADVVVFGGGGAATRAALSARQAGAQVRLAAKAPLQFGGSTVHGASEIMSMGAAGFGDAHDRPEVHFEDTMRAGRGFIDPTLVQVLAEDAPRRIRDLIELGVPFDRVGDGYKLIKSDFGSHARALGVSGRTGKAFVQALSDEMLRLGVAVDAPVMLVDLVRDTNGEIAGAVGYDLSRRRLVHYEAPSVVLGTGGMHGAFEQQVSTPEMTGDGQAICFRHGAEMVNLEFHQFGPALIRPYVQLFSGSCFALHPRLLNAEGKEFLSRYVPPGIDMDEVYGRKVFTFTTSNVSRYIDIGMAREIAAGRGTPNGAVLFSFAGTPPARIAAFMPNTARWMAEHGLDVEHDALEVGIAFQCMNGGVRMTGADAQSTIPGLYVIGELAGGIRGPDRPGGNSLGEGQVFGHRAGTAAAGRASGRREGAAASLSDTLDFLAATLHRRPSLDLAEGARIVRRDMQRHCLVEKHAEGLEAALDAVSEVGASVKDNLAATVERLPEALGLRNMALASELVLRACANRRETRSAHYRLDFPQAGGPDLAKSFVVQRDGDAILFRSHFYEPPSKGAISHHVQ